MNPHRTKHITNHRVGPGHMIVVRRLGGRDLWVVEENYLGRVTDLADGALFTDRAEADVIAEAYVAICTHHTVSGGSLVDEIEHLGRQLDAGNLTADQAAHLLQQYSDGGLTRLGAIHMLHNWRGARARYRRIFEDTAALLRRIEERS